MKPELYRAIVDSTTDQSTIYTLLFVSSSFNYEAERALYRKVAPKGRGNQEKLFRQLYGHERVAKLVLDCHFSVRKKFNIRDDPSYWTSLNLALRTLTNLKSFRIWYPPLHGSPMAHLLDGCLFQLESFDWPFLLEEKVIRFLETQPRIQRLNLQWSFYNCPVLSLTALPQLSVLAGSKIVIESILPGRRITHLFWDSGPFDQKADLARIGPALNNIRVLKYGGFLPHPLNIIIECLSKLEVLELDEPNHTEITANAPFLTNLRKVILPQDRNEPNPENIVARLFAGIPTLRTVDSRFKGEGEGADFRWVRDSDIPQTIVMHRDDWMSY